MIKLKSPLNKMKNLSLLGMMVISVFFSAFMTQSTPVYAASVVEHDPSWEPVILEEGTITQDRSIKLEYYLEAGKTYHIFLVGNWTEEEPATTDYDVYVTGPSGEVYRFTEAKGLPEPIFNDGVGQLFVPETSGTYAFEIRNDSEDEESADGAVFMLIEHVETDVVKTASLMGRTSKSGAYPEDSVMTYACEFTTDASSFKIHVDTPEDLDLYEVRLYTMAALGNHGHDLYEMPTPLGSDFTGNGTEGYGGYSYEIDGIEAPIYASFYDYGVEMDLTPNSEAESSTSTLKTYFLVFIAEYSKESAASTVPFYIKVDDTSPEPTLSEPLDEIFAGDTIPVSADVASSKALASVWLSYSVNGVAEEPITMTLDEGHYVCDMPVFSVDDVVEYSISALDDLDTLGVYSSSFVVRGRTVTTCAVSSTYVIGGGELDVAGMTTNGGSVVDLNFTCGSFSEIIPVNCDSSGRFSCSYTPKTPGQWTVTAMYEGNDSYEGSSSIPSSFLMEPLSTSISCSVVAPSVKVNEVVELIGNTVPAQAGIPIEILLTSGSEVKTLSLTSGSDGSFKVSEQLGEGQWDIVAQVKGNWRFSSSSSSIVSASVVPLSSTELLMLQLMALSSPPYIYVLLLASGIILALLVRWKSSVIVPKLPAPMRGFLNRFSSPSTPKRRQSSGVRESYKRQSDESET